MKRVRYVAVIATATVLLLFPSRAAAQAVALAQAAAATLVDVADNPGQYESLYRGIVQGVRGYHPTYSWQTVDGVTFCVVPFGGGGTRLTYNFSADPFLKSRLGKPRPVEFRLLNVQPQYRQAVWWTVQSDVPGGSDANRQQDCKHKTRDGDVIRVATKEEGDGGFYLAGRWDPRIGKQEFSRANPGGGVLLILR